MPRSVPPCPEVVADVHVLIRAHHPLIALKTRDDARADNICAHVALAERLDLWHWRPHKGLFRPFFPKSPQSGTKDVLSALDFARENEEPGIYDMGQLSPFADSAEGISALKEIHANFFKTNAALIFRSEGSSSVPESLGQCLTWVDVGTPSPREYYLFANALIKELRTRMPLEIRVTDSDVEEIVAKLSGLTLFEAKKVLSQVLVEHHGLSKKSIERIAEIKRDRLSKSASFEFTPTPKNNTKIAGLENLQKWLDKRSLAFQSPEKAKAFGLSPPRGLLLLGVQGCGKSLSAKAIASAWKMPLLRFDPASIYKSYLGQTEENLRNAMESAESMAPVVLWIDELEKAFARGDNDGGTSGRVLGTFLHWLQEKPDGVFVVATANDIKTLPPELLRKGRFDEIFFVDLPRTETRSEILKIHIEKRGHDSSRFDTDEIARAADGFSGAELEQAVISALYRAFGGEQPFTTESIITEIKSTKPLSVTRRESIDSLRSWASKNAVLAGK